jgi:hypothetical protein
LTRAELFVALCVVMLGGCGEMSRPASPPSDAEARLRALVDSLLPTLQQISGLTARAPVNVALRSPEQVRSFVDLRLAEDFPPDELAGAQAAYALLGLIPDSLDLRQLLSDLYAEQIVGYYDPDSTMLYVTQGVPAEAVRPVLVHELVHALQDQQLDLDSLIARERGNDRQLAAQALIEGHATLVMLAFQARETSGRSVHPGELPDPSAQIRSGLDAGQQYPVFRSAPRLLREVLIFPYAEGTSFAWTVWASQPAQQRLPLAMIIPESTEQVLDPRAKFMTRRDTPTEVRFTEGSDWRVLYENNFGALETRLFLEISDAAGQNAEGWDGDRYRVLEDAAGRRALVWFSVWDTAEGASAFAAATARALGTGESGQSAAIMVLDAGRPAVRVVVVTAGLEPNAVRAGELTCTADACTVR